MQRYGARLLLAVAASIGLLATALMPNASAHPVDAADGHIPANTNYGFEVVGRDLLDGIADGLYTDVWSHDGFAYVGTFQDPECSTAGVYIVDIAAAIDNYSNGEISGATVAEINSPPDTRINDVKVHTVGDIDVLITTEEPCGVALKGGADSGEARTKGCPLQAGPESDGTCGRANDNGTKGDPGVQWGAPTQKGRGGISLWDVTDPTKPKPLNTSFLDYRGVHNTFSWTDASGSSYLIGVADTFDFLDTFIVDITNPKKPELLVQTGILDWLDDGFSFDQLETGTFGFIGLHDVWVEELNGVQTAVLPYWDAGFITLDVSDPANPVFLGDSDYPDPDPVLDRPYEGNAHAAVFGGDEGEYIYAGDEDFDPYEQAISFDGVTYPAGTAQFGPQDVALTGEIVWTGGEGCTVAEVPAATADGQIALMQRGSCFFSDKVASAEAQGYAGAIIANDAARGDATLNMSAGSDDPIGIPSAFVGYSTGELMKLGGTVDGLVQDFNGWGYFHVLNNSGSTITVPDQFPGPDPTVDVGQLGEIGYYAPAEAVEAQFTPGFGDLTMHNVEADPLTQSIEPTFNEGPRSFISWYSLGMRAVEYRPGHFHDNTSGEGSYSWNVHEVGRFIAEDGSNFWGVHVDEIDGQQIILGSDRNTGLWIFTFSCETRLDDGTSVFYCDPLAGAPEEGQEPGED